MKYLFSIVVAIVVIDFNNSVNAQFSLGLRAGLNLAKENYTGTPFGSTSLDTRTGFLCGIYSTIGFNEKLGIQPELFYSSLGGKSGSVAERINYISLPIFFRINATRNFYFLLGPQVSMLVAAKFDEGNGTIIDEKSNFNIPDFAITPGIGVNFGSFDAGIRYAFGTANIAKGLPSGASLKNNALQFVVGCRIFGK